MGGMQRGNRWRSLLGGGGFDESMSRCKRRSSKEVKKCRSEEVRK